MEEKVLDIDNAGDLSGENPVGGEGEMTAEKPYANEAENERSRELEAENLRLKGELACAKAGIPGEIAGDIISIAVNMKNASGDGNLEEAVREVYERICSAVYGVNNAKGNYSGRNDRRSDRCFGNGAFGKGSSGVTTGVRSERGFDDTDAALRRACGLKG